MNFLTKNIKTISIVLFALVVIFIFVFSAHEKRTEKNLFCFDTLIDISLSGKNAATAISEIESVLAGTHKTCSSADVIKTK